MGRKTDKKEVSTFENGQIKTELEELPKVRRVQRSRKFNIITYIDINAIGRFLKCAEWVHHYAFIKHDRDLKEDGSKKELHTHILIYTYEAKTATAIFKIFDRFAVEICLIGVEPQNTRVQIMNDSVSCWRYLRHLDDPDKAQYDMNEVTCDNYSYWHKLECTQGLSGSENIMLSMFDDFVIDKMPVREFLIRYGKDGGYHIRQLNELCRLYHTENTNKNIKPDIDEILLNCSPFRESEIKLFWQMYDYLQTHYKQERHEELGFCLQDYFEKNKKS